MVKEARQHCPQWVRLGGAVALASRKVNASQREGKKAHVKREASRCAVVYDHTTLKTPVLVRSPKLSNVGPAQNRCFQCGMVVDNCTSTRLPFNMGFFPFAL